MYSHNDPNSQFSITIYCIMNSLLFHFTHFLIFIAHQISHQIGRIQLFKHLECIVEEIPFYNLPLHFHHDLSIAIPFHRFIGCVCLPMHNCLSLAHTVFQLL